jgi:hypothetical protein
VTAENAQQVVFIDSRVPDIQDLLDGLQPGEQAFVIDPSRDGVQQIADILAANNFTNLSAISIVSHGESGEVTLGSTVLTDGDLAAHSSALAEIGASLAPAGAIQLFGCDVAQGPTGQQFINDFSSFAGGVQVDAATHIVGGAAFGGSWTLDAASDNGGAAVAPPFTSAPLANFAGALAAPVTTEVWYVTNGVDNNTQSLDDGENVAGSGTASNHNTLLGSGTAGAPFVHAVDVGLDTPDGLYFVVDSSGNGEPNVIEKGTLSQALAGQTSFTTIYSETLGAAEGAIEGLAVDAPDQLVYFIQSDPDEVNASFDRVGFNGGPATTLATVAGVSFQDVTLDLAHDSAYVTAISAYAGFGSTFVGANLIYDISGVSGTSATATVLPIAGSPGDNFPSSLGLLEGIAVDTVHEVLYFTTEATSSTGNGGIFFYDLTGNPSHTFGTVWLQPSPDRLSTTAGTPFSALGDIELDLATGVYYVTDHGMLAGVGVSDNSIYVGGLVGGSLSTTPMLFLSASNGAAPAGMALDNAPTLSFTSGATFTESTLNPAAANNTPVAAISAVSAGDSDNSALVGATVTVGGFFVGDVLSAATTGTSITQSYNSTTGVLTLTGKDTLADYQSVLASLTFTSTSDNPTDFGADPSRTLTVTVNDGLLSSAPQTATVTVTGVNDPPTLSGTTNTSFTENGPAVTLSPAAAVSDPDNLDLAGATVAITGGGFVGDADVLAVNVAGTSITASYDAAAETLVLAGSDSLADYQQVLESVAFASTSDNPTDFGADPTRTVTWQLNDGSASNNLSAVSTTTVSITAVNDPPTLSNVATNASYTEQAAATTLSASLAVSDPDSLSLASATVHIAGGAFAGDGDVLAANVAGTAITAIYNAVTETLLLAGTDSLADYQQVLGSVAFASTSDNPTDFGADPTRTVSWVLNDGSGSNNLSAVVTTTVSIMAVNDPPTLAGTTDASFTENGPAVTLSPAAAVSDPDNLTLAGATVAITGGGFVGDADVLAVNVAGTSITASYDAAAETLVLAGSDSLADYQQVLESVAFASTSDNPTDFGADPTRTVTWQLNDGSASNNLSAVSTTTVSITAVNDPPTLSNVATNASYTEQATATTLSPSLAVSDPDNLSLAGASVHIAGGAFAGDGDVLAADTTGTSITASYNAATETLTLSGVDTLADYQSVLDSVTFVDSSDNPTNYGSNPTRTITWVVADGSASNGTSAVATTTLNVTAVNDPPTLAGVPTTGSFSAGQTLTVAPAASLSDPDNLTLASATVQVTGGTFAGDTDVLAAKVAGTAITVSYNAATETLTLNGSDTLAHYQQVLDSVTFTTGANPTNFGLDPTRTLTWTVDDGSTSNNTATATTTISISTSLVKNDFDGDRRSDILLQDRIGPLHGPTLIDFMNGTSVAAQATLSGPGITWQLIGSGDFNSDGRADILWQNIDGTPQIWTMNGSTVTSETTLADPGITWRAVGTGDFNGDGTSDIVFQNIDGTPQIWTMDGTSVASTATLPDPGATWRLIGTGDFNGDGKSDLVFQSPNGTPMIWLMNGTSVTATATLSQPSGAGSCRLIGTGDFNGDGDADLLFQKANGTPMIWTMNGTSVVATTTLADPGPTWRAVGTGDYNGDGKSDILFQNVDGTPMVWTMNGTSVIATATLPNPGATWHANTG